MWLNMWPLKQIIFSCDRKLLLNVWKSLEHFRLNHSSFLAKSALASFCGIFFVRDVLDAIQSSLLNEKSSTNMSWCSWQPRNPKCCVKKKHIVAIKDFSDWLPRALWTTTVLHLQWSVPLTHGDVCRSPVHGGSELSLRVLCGCQQTLYP